MARLSITTKKFLLLRNRLEEKKKKYKKCVWVRKVYQERKQKGEFHLLIKDMMLYDHFLFFKYFRMNPTQYEQLLQKIAPRIQKSSEKREQIGPSERLSVALRYIFTGDSQKSIASSFRISLTSIGRIVHETMNVIWDVLRWYIPIIFRF